MKSAFVTGAGGFIGGHLVRALLAEGTSVRATDVKPAAEWLQFHGGARSFDHIDLRREGAARNVLVPGSEVYHLACDMGGMGFIELNKAACMLNVLIDTHMLMTAEAVGASRYLYASTACVYRAGRQDSESPDGLREDYDVYPAQPEDGYGWMKLFGERMCRHFREDYGTRARVARFHSVYGPYCTWDGGREKVPAALCRKVAVAKLTGRDTIEVWGDGKQARSFLYVDDAVSGILALARGDCHDPLNIGSDYAVSVDELAWTVMEAAGYRCAIEYVDGPLGVRGRTSDNAKAWQEIGWAPSVRLAEGIERTYAWIEDQVRAAL